MKRRNGSIFVGIQLLLLIITCSCDKKVRISLHESLTETLKVIDKTVPTYENNIPENYRSTFSVVPKDKESASGMKADSVIPNLIIDATGEKILFPLKKEPRKFKNKEELDKVLQSYFGADQVLSQDSAVSFQGSYVTYGTPCFYDPVPGIWYKITDPLLAYLGGASGTIEVAAKPVCVDPDGNCNDQSYASYLEPLGEEMRLTHVDNCGPAFSNGTAVCVQHHSFWNNHNVFFLPWIRHGTNIRFTSYSALPESRLIARSRIFYERATSPGGETEGLPTVNQTGVNSVETAGFCWGGCPQFLARAIVVCGRTSVQDPDITDTAFTGNGPGNDPTDPGFQCP